MISLQDYLADPCGALSIPYWKAKRISVPPGTEIVHHSRFRPEMAEGRGHSSFFRLMHRLRAVPRFEPPPGVVLAPLPLERAGEAAELVNRCYRHSGIRVTEGEVRGWAGSPVYRPELWAGAFADGALIGSVVGEFDPEAGEGVIEWLQVLPEYRGHGIAAALTSWALEAMGGFADFATVSGQCENPTRPERVYRACGFQGDDVWHILR